MTLLKSIKNIDNVELIIIGYGSQEKKLKDFIEKNTLENKVHILKNISNPYPFSKLLIYLFYLQYMRVFLMF